jgi:DegV family protein with EDD domain
LRGEWLEVSEVAILTDSVAQIPPDLAQQYHIGVIPFSVIVEEKSFLEGRDIHPIELYKRMRTETISLRTSHPSLGEYMDFFRRYLDKGAQSVLYLALTGKLSGGFDTAIKAAEMLEEEYPGKKIVVFDTGTVTIAQGFLAIHAARAAEDGLDIEGIVTDVQEEKSKVGFLVMLETLIYLQRGGRIGKAVYLVGDQINIKPIITIGKEGVVTPVGIVRGEKKCEEKLVKCMVKTIGDKAPTQVAVMHADNLERAEQLQARIQERYNLEEILITDFTPVLGAHTGPGVVGLAYQLE